MGHRIIMDEKKAPGRLQLVLVICIAAMLAVALLALLGSTFHEFAFFSSSVRAEQQPKLTAISAQGRLQDNSEAGLSGKDFRLQVEDFKELLQPSSLFALYFADGGFSTPTRFSYDWNIVGVAEGTYYIKVAVRDTLNRTVEKVVAQSVRLIGNYRPDVNIVAVDGNSFGGSTIACYYDKDFNVAIDFNVSDLDNNSLFFSFAIATSQLGLRTTIASNISTDALRCEDRDFSDSTKCTYDWNITGLATAYYYLYVMVRDAGGLSKTGGSPEPVYVVGDYRPSISIASVAGYTALQDMPAFSYMDASIIPIEFDVSDFENEQLTVGFYRYRGGEGWVSIEAFRDLNALSCEDYNFSDTTRCTYNWSIVGVPDANYYLRATAWDNTQGASFLWPFSLRVIGNNPPRVNIIAIDGNNLLGEIPIFNILEDSILSIDFNIMDNDDNSFLVDINYATAAVEGTGSRIVQDINTHTLSCLDYNFVDWTTCSYNWHAAGTVSGSYHLLMRVNDSAQGVFTSSNPFKIYSAGMAELGICPAVQEITTMSLMWLKPTISTDIAEYRLKASYEPTRASWREVYTTTDVNTLNYQHDFFEAPPTYCGDGACSPSENCPEDSFDCPPTYMCTEGCQPPTYLLDFASEFQRVSCGDGRCIPGENCAMDDSSCTTQLGAGYACISGCVPTAIYPKISSNREMCGDGYCSPTEYCPLDSRGCDEGYVCGNESGSGCQPLIFKRFVCGDNICLKGENCYADTNFCAATFGANFACINGCIEVAQADYRTGKSRFYADAGTTDAFMHYMLETVDTAGETKQSQIRCFVDSESPFMLFHGSARAIVKDFGRGDLNFFVPAGSMTLGADNNIIIDVNHNPPPAIGFRLIHAYDFELSDDTNFSPSNPPSITMDINVQAMSCYPNCTRAHIARAAIYRYNEISQAWEKLPSLVNLDNNTVTADVNHFSVIAEGEDENAPLGAYCGDGSCNGTETCSSCPWDCGSCSRCGNGILESGEQCESDGHCATGQFCSNCSCESSAEAGAYCGDGSCKAGESCSSCPADCGVCHVCGNKVIEGSEQCESDNHCGTGQSCISCSCALVQLSCSQRAGDCCSGNEQCFGDALNVTDCSGAVCCSVPCVSESELAIIAFNVSDAVEWNDATPKNAEIVATVQNKGGIDTEPFSVILMAAAAGEARREIATKRVAGGLNGKSQISLNFSFVYDPANPDLNSWAYKDVELTVVVDAYNEVREFDETNNEEEAVAYFGGPEICANSFDDDADGLTDEGCGLPNLWVKSVSVGGRQYEDSTLDYVDFNVVIRNDFMDINHPFEVTFYKDYAGSSDAAFTYINSMKNGQETTMHFSWSRKEGAIVFKDEDEDENKVRRSRHSIKKDSFWILVDSAGFAGELGNFVGEVEEVSETDNLREVALCLDLTEMAAVMTECVEICWDRRDNDADGLTDENCMLAADLYFVERYPIPEFFLYEGPIEFSVIIGNGGLSDAESFEAALYLDDTLIETRVVDGLKAANEKSLSFSADSNEWYGLHTLKLIIDEPNVVQEINERNNEMEKSILVAYNAFDVALNYNNSKFIGDRRQVKFFDRFGKVVPGAAVQLTWPKGKRMDFITDSDGMIEFLLDEEGEYNVHATKKRFEPFTGSFAIPRINLLFNETVPVGATQVIKALTEQNIPPQDVVVELITPQGERIAIDLNRPNATGYYRTLVGGEYKIVASRKDIVFFQDRFESVGGRETIVTIAAGIADIVFGPIWQSWLLLLLLLIMCLVASYVAYHKSIILFAKKAIGTREKKKQAAIRLGIAAAFFTMPLLVNRLLGFGPATFFVLFEIAACFIADYMHKQRMKEKKAVKVEKARLRL